MRFQSSIFSSFLSLRVLLAASFALTACSPTVRDFGGGAAGGSSSSTSSNGGSGGQGGDGCAPPLTVCGAGCTDTRADPANCGACGTECTAPANAVATCISSTCGSACDGAHADCNSLPDDGCEIDITTDAANCGGCGNPCLAEMGSTPSCQNAVCGASCESGRSDCNDTVPGCETNIQSDSANCGGCGIACPRRLACVSGSCTLALRCLSGSTGDTWEPVPPSRDGNHGFESYVRSGSAHMYLASQAQLSRYDIATSTWESLAAPPVAFPYWGAPISSGGFVWALRAQNLMRYDPLANAWAILRTDLHSGDSMAITVADDAGHLWSYNSSQEIVEYDPSTDVVTYHPTGVTDDAFETRLGWDRLSNSVLFGGYNQAIIHRYDVSSGVISRATPHPEGTLNDIFCADHCGHVYAAGGGSGSTFWQYDIATNTWRQIPDYPVNHGNDGSCSVHAGGWLYVETGTTSGNVFRLRLL